MLVISLLFSAGLSDSHSFRIFHHFVFVVSSLFWPAIFARMSSVICSFCSSYIVSILYPRAFYSGYSSNERIEMTMSFHKLGARPRDKSPQNVNYNRSEEHFQILLYHWISKLSWLNVPWVRTVSLNSSISPPVLNLYLVRVFTAVIIVSPFSFSTTKWNTNMFVYPLMVSANVECLSLTNP